MSPRVSRVYILSLCYSWNLILFHFVVQCPVCSPTFIITNSIHCNLCYLLKIIWPCSCLKFVSLCILLSSNGINNPFCCNVNQLYSMRSWAICQRHLCIHYFFCFIYYFAPWFYYSLTMISITFFLFSCYSHLSSDAKYQQKVPTNVVRSKYRGCV